MQLMGWKDKGNVGGREDCVAVVLGGEKVVEEVWRKQSACWKRRGSWRCLPGLFIFLDNQDRE